MDAYAHQIHTALQAVEQLRQQHAAHTSLRQASVDIKRFQARRFQATYADLLQSPRYHTAATFFLHELYSDKDYAERDQQFARIANTIAKLFPQTVVNTAAALAQVHALTEALDNSMAQQWLNDTAQGCAQDEPTQHQDCARYVRCWRSVADSATRHQQLGVVQLLGQELNRLTCKPGLRTLLKLMRGPANAAGLSSLQRFLEAGFDAFATMRGADEFLALIRARETEWIRSLFEDDAAVCQAKLSELLATQAPSG